MTEKPESDAFFPLTTNNHEVIGVREKANGKQTITALQPLQEGRPLPASAELVEVETDGQGNISIRSMSHKGPARVSNKKYRKNYDQIFSKRQLDPTLN